MSAANPAAADLKLDAAVRKVAGVVVLGAITSILDITVVSLAEPSFQTVFHTSYANVASTMTATRWPLATVIPPSGHGALADVEHLQIERRDTGEHEHGSAPARLA